MIDATTLITEVQSEFEGGVSLSLDWNSVTQNAVRKVLKETKPKNLKRLVPIYGGLVGGFYVYQCPSDLKAPSDIYGNDGVRKFTYQPSRAFYANNLSDKYTIDTINNVRCLVVRHGEMGGTLVIDQMDAVGTKTGGTPTLNTFNHLYGSGAVQATFTDAGVEFGDDIDAIDVTEYMRGALVLPSYIPDVSKLASLEVRLKTTDADYIKVTTTADSISDYLMDGWNTVTFSMENKVTVGSPNLASIVEWSIIGTTETGETMTIIFDRLFLSKTTMFYLEYFTRNAFVNGSTGAHWQETLTYTNNDKINLEDDLYDVLYYEMCVSVNQKSKFGNVDSQAISVFNTQRIEAWRAYWAENPSGEAPMTYSKSPQIDISQDMDWGTIQDNTESIM